MKDFLFLEYHTEYSCDGDINKELDVEACFGNIFHTGKQTLTETYNIIVYQGTSLSKNEHESNACLLDKRQIINHLNQLKYFYPFKFKISEEAEWNNVYDVFILTITLVKKPLMFHKYLLTWVRYLYEYPYNVILFDAYKLKKESCFRFTSISNLFNLILGCFNENPRTIHQIPDNKISESLSRKEIKTKLEEIDRLNDIYKYLKDKNKVIPEGVKGFQSTDLEYWENEEIYEKYRKPIYLNTFKRKNL